MANYVWASSLVVKTRGYWIKKHCAEGPIPDGEKFAQDTKIAVFAAGTGYLKNAYDTNLLIRPS